MCPSKGSVLERTNTLNKKNNPSGRLISQPLIETSRLSGFNYPHKTIQFFISRIPLRFLLNRFYDHNHRRNNFLNFVCHDFNRDVNKDLTPKDQDKDKDLTPKNQDKDLTTKDQDKDNDLLDLTPKDKDLTPHGQGQGLEICP